MPIFLHRSNRVEALVGSLCEVLGNDWPTDPFARVPVVVGSRGMARYLRHEIATRLEVACGLEFPFPRQAFAGASRWLLGGAADPTADFWILDEQQQEAAARFEREALAFRLVPLLRKRSREPYFEQVGLYLANTRGQAHPNDAVTSRELLFALDVADVLDRLIHDRPLEALAWARDPATADTQHRFLATLLGDLDVAGDARSPARLFAALAEATPPKVSRMLCVFGLSTLGPGDRQRIAAIARTLDVHLFVLAPTQEWFVDQRTRQEYRRAIAAATHPEQLARIELERRHENPIVATLGAPSRDLQDWLEDVGYTSDDTLYSDPTADGPPETLLSRLHAWMLKAEGLGHVRSPWPFDGDCSLQLHATYGAMRQCEVLRDQLLHLFARDPTLQPRDVIVMTPDIETYAPLVAATFARRGLAQAADDGERDESDRARLPAIATAIADLGLTRTNPVAEVMLALLELAGERLTATRVAALLSLAPVRMRFGIDDDSSFDLTERIGASGLRWGLDADDRARADQPARDQNTARFAAERLALGVLMPDEDPLFVVGSCDSVHGLGPAVPLDAPGTAAVEHSAQLLGLLRAIGAERSLLAGPLSLPRWRARLMHALEIFSAVPSDSAWLATEVTDALDELVTHGAALGELPVSRDALRKWLTGRFEIPQRGEPRIANAVTVCALQPMRSVPFRVVALLGMDDGAFPRGGRPKPWDPFERRKSGERDAREIDRHLLLEAILSAREHLLLSWSGHDEQKGTTKAAAVPVEELIETLGALTQRARAQLVREHPLQPWSEKNFLPTATSHDAGLARAAQLRRELRAGKPAASRRGLLECRTTLLHEPAHPARELSIDALASAVCRPQKVLLHERLGLWLQRERWAIEDREPLDPDKLKGARKITERVLQQLRGVGNGDDDASTLLDQLEQRLAGEGTLPAHAGRRVLLETHVQLAQDTLRYGEDIAGVRGDPLELSWQGSSGIRLVGHVADVRTIKGGLLLQWVSAYDPNARAELGALLHLLVACATGQPVAAVRLVGPSSARKKKCAGGVLLALAEPSPEVARRRLDDLLAVYARACRMAIPLFERTSPAAASTLSASASSPDATQAPLLHAIDEAWEGDGYRRQGERRDPWVAPLFSDYEPADDLGAEPNSFLDLCTRVWLPVCEARAAGETLRAALTPGDAAANSGSEEDA